MGIRRLLRSSFQAGNTFVVESRIWLASLPSYLNRQNYSYVQKHGIGLTFTNANFTGRIVFSSSILFLSVNSSIPSTHPSSLSSSLVSSSS
jgi:hypothetical protein